VTYLKQATFLSRCRIPRSRTFLPSSTSRIVVNIVNIVNIDLDSSLLRTLSMGCFPSILRPRPPPDQSDPIEGKRSPKSSDSDSQSCKFTSPGPSTDLEFPFTSIAPPTLSEPSFAPRVESINVGKEPLDLPIEEVNHEIAALITAIEDCQSLSTDYKQRTFKDINAILDVISENSLVYTKLEILLSQLNTLYRENESHFGGYLHSAIESIPTLWMEFLELDEEQQRQHARTQSASSSIMQIFGHLSRLRSASDAQHDLHSSIERKVGEQFHDILGDLRDLGAREPALKWSVLEMVDGQRMREIEGKLDGLLRARIRVSGLLLEVVEALSEEE
jgi:hypothetical protein